MTAPARGRRRRPARRRIVTPARLVALVGIGVAFVLGIGLGEALHDSPSGGAEATVVQTLGPVPLVPITRETVTVTTPNP